MLKVAGGFAPGVLGRQRGLRLGVEQGFDLDQIGVYTALTTAVESAAAELENGSISREGWNAVAGAVGPGPLAALVQEMRG